MTRATGAVDTAARAAVVAFSLTGLASDAAASWRFDGGGDAWLDYGDLDLVDAGRSGEFSCFCVIKAEQIGTGTRLIAGEVEAGGTGWSLTLAPQSEAGSADRVTLTVGGSQTATATVADDAPVPVGAWLAVGGSYVWGAGGDGAMQLFIDGASHTAAAPVGHPAPPDAGAWRVGGAGRSGGGIDGRVGHVAVWREVAALSPDEHTLLADGADPRTIQPQALVFYASLEDDDAQDAVAGVSPSIGPAAVFSTDRWPGFKPLVVTQGHVRPDAITIASHVGRSTEHVIEYTPDRFPGAQTAPVTALESDDFVVATEIRGLEPATSYRYRLRIDDMVVDASEATFTTAPAPGGAAFSFVVASCSRYDEHIAPFPRFSFDAFAGIAALQPDFLVHCGDVWYSDLGGQNETQDFNAWALNTVDAYNRKVRETLGERSLSALLREVPWYSMPDDHEWTNNISNVAALGGANLLRYQRGLDRVLNWQFKSHPPRLPEALRDGGLWYSFEYGGVDFFFLDVRTQRSANGAPNDGAKKMLGPDDRQLQDLMDWLEVSVADFKVILSPGMISRFGTTGNDAWGTPTGFGTDAASVLESIARHDNVVFFAGDVHWSGVVRLAEHADGIPAHGLYEFIGAPFAGHLSNPPASRDDDLLFTYDGRLADPDRTSYLLVEVDTLASPAMMQVSVVSHDPCSGNETVEYAHPPLEHRCPQDVDGDGQIGIDDFAAVIVAWGAPDRLADVDHDGLVGIGDLAAVIVAWGACR